MDWPGLSSSLNSPYRSDLHRSSMPNYQRYLDVPNYLPWCSHWLRAIWRTCLVVSPHTVCRSENQSASYIPSQLHSLSTIWRPEEAIALGQLPKACWLHMHLVTKACLYSVEGIFRVDSPVGKPWHSGSVELFNSRLSMMGFGLCHCSLYQLESINQ